MAVNSSLSPANMSTQVKSWILEYSIKHNLDNILKQFECKNGPIPVRNCTLPAQQFNPANCLPPSYLLLWFVHRTFKRLENPSQFENVEKLQYLLQVLQKLFVWCDTVPLDTFWSLHTKIKMMVLLQSLRRKSATPQLFDDYFPPWSRDYEEKLKQEYTIKNETVLELIRKDHESCRLFMFSLMFSKDKITAFYKQFLVFEWGEYVGNLKRLFMAFVEAVLPVLPETEIEDILQGNVSEELKISKNPAIRILLKALNSCSDEIGSVETALKGALLALDGMTADRSKCTPLCSRKISPNFPEQSCEMSPAYMVPGANNESCIATPIPQNEMAQINSTQDDEPVPSTSTGITHEKGKKRNMRTLLQRKQRDKRRRIFKNSSRYLFLSSEDDSS